MNILESPKKFSIFIGITLSILMIIFSIAEKKTELEHASQLTYLIKKANKTCYPLSRVLPSISDKIIFDRDPGSKIIAYCVNPKNGNDIMKTIFVTI